MIFDFRAINSIKLQGLHFYIIDINLSGNRRVKTCTNFQPILKRVWEVGVWRWLGCCLWWRVTQQRPLFRGPWAACSASGSAFYPSDPSATKLGGNWETPWFETKTQKRIFPAPISANCKPEQHLRKFLIAVKSSLSSRTILKIKLSWLLKNSKFYFDRLI